MYEFVEGGLDNGTTDEKDQSIWALNYEASSPRIQPFIFQAKGDKSIQFQLNRQNQRL